MANFRFPIKVKNPSGFVNSRIIRDNYKRQLVANHEVTTTALKFISRNTLFPARVRLEAQLQLTAMPNYTRLNQVKNRCVESGNSHSVNRDFRLCRQQFRQRGKEGDLPGVKKGVW